MNADVQGKRSSVQDNLLVPTSGPVLIIKPMRCTNFSKFILGTELYIFRTVTLSETCRVLFLKQIWEISASHCFYYKNIWRCTVLWMSKWPVYYAFQEVGRLLTKELFSLRSHTSVEQTFVLLKQLSNQCASTQWD